MDLILTRAEIQMDTWKPDATKTMQEFQDFDNEGLKVSMYQNAFLMLSRTQNYAS